MAYLLFFSPSTPPLVSQISSLTKISAGGLGVSTDSFDAFDLSVSTSSLGSLKDRKDEEDEITQSRATYYKEKFFWDLNADRDQIDDLRKSYIEGGFFFFCCKKMAHGMEYKKFLGGEPQKNNNGTPTKNTCQ